MYSIKLTSINFSILDIQFKIKTTQYINSKQGRYNRIIIHSLSLLNVEK
jgi:hypothetical protein